MYQFHEIQTQDIFEIRYINVYFCYMKYLDNAINTLYYIAREIRNVKEDSFIKFKTRNLPFLSSEIRKS